MTGNCFAQMDCTEVYDLRPADYITTTTTTTTTYAYDTITPRYYEST